VHYISSSEGAALTREEKRAALLHGLGAAVRARRTACGLTLRALAKKAEVSERFLVQLETGEGNISVARLADVAEALDTTGAELLAKAGDVRTPPRRIVSLLGLRGAGKSTVGALVARELCVPFFELDAMIVAEAGMGLATLFEIHGEAYFRRLERDTLRKVLEQTPLAVVATGGSLVKDRDTFALLKRRTCTVWLKASAKEHWDRVVAQGDVRPMRNRTNAMSELKALLRARKQLYSQAEYVVDTSAAGPEDAVRQVLAAVAADRNVARERDRDKSRPGAEAAEKRVGAR
jgi:XRE family transcriptional regulator, aerobic/anaerobic benzoate catabolism transcriptional regulator